MTVEYKSNLRNLAAQIDQELALALHDTANDIANLAQQLAPEDTGALKASKDVRPDANGFIVSFGRGLPDIRAVAQEYGTATNPAQPYLTPAVAAIDPVFRAKARIDALIAKNRV